VPCSSRVLAPFQAATLDRFSDYDVTVVVTDILPFFENREWLKSFGDVLVVYRDPIRDQLGYRRFAYVTQYADGSKIDFTLWPVALLKQIVYESKLPSELDIGYSVLLDKDHLADQLQAPTHKAHIPAPPTEAEFQTLVEEFFHESTHVAKHLRRGDLMPLKYNLDQAMKQLSLRRILEWQIEIDHHWSVKPGANGKELKNCSSRRSGPRSNRPTWSLQSKITGTLCLERFLCSARQRKRSPAFLNSAIPMNWIREWSNTYNM